MAISWREYGRKSRSKIWIWDPRYEIRDPKTTYSESRIQDQKDTGSRTRISNIVRWSSGLVILVVLLLRSYSQQAQKKVDWRRKNFISKIIIFSHKIWIWIRKIPGSGSESHLVNLDPTPIRYRYCIIARITYFLGTRTVTLSEKAVFRIHAISVWIRNTAKKAFLLRYRTYLTIFCEITSTVPYISAVPGLDLPWVIVA